MGAIARKLQEEVEVDWACNEKRRGLRVEE